MRNEVLELLRYCSSSVVCLSLAGAVGCSSSSDGNLPVAGGPNGNADAAAATSDADAAAATSDAATSDADGSELVDSGIPDAPGEASMSGFDGVWALKLVMTSSMDAPLVGKTKTVSTTLLRVNQKLSGDQLSIAIHTCAFDVNAGSQVQIIVPDAYIAALSDETVPGTLVEEGGKYKLHVPKYYQLRGVKLEHPETDALPTDPKDARVYDQDKDGHPGMTMSVTGLAKGDMYVIQRAWFVLEGEAKDTSSLDGLVTFDMEQVVLDATNPMLKMLPATTPDPDPSLSYFRHRRVDEAFDCATIIAKKDELFGN